MFSKPTNKPSTAQARPDAQEPMRRAIACSLIAENVRLQGDLVSEGDVQLDGALSGDLKAMHLSIGETGLVDGAIAAESVEIRGRVTGQVSARSVKLFATAHVDGDIIHDQLAIEAGAHFAGRSLKGPPAAEQLSLPIAAE